MSTANTATRDVKQLPVRLPPDVYDRLKALSFFTGAPMNQIVVHALIEFLDSTGDEAQARFMLERARAEYRPVLDKLKDL